MKKKNYPLFCVVVMMVLVVVLCLFLAGKWLVSNENETKNEGYVTNDAESLTIDIPEPATKGSFTIYEPDGSIHFQYQGGFFKVKNDGFNGEDVEICVYLPVEGTCSCFEDGEEDGQ